MERVFSCIGLVALVGVAWLMSVKRRAFPWRVVLWGVGLQLLFGVVILLPAAGEVLFEWVDVGIRKLLSFSEAGSDFLFQTVQAHQISVIDHAGESHLETFIGRISPPLKSFAFWTLPTVIFFSALMTVLYHYGIMQRVVSFFARIMQHTMGTSGAESLSAAANIFVGQTEAPLVVRPFVQKMTVSELNAVMVGGFATIAGGVMAIYVGVLGSIPGIAGHLVMASIMSAPAALAIAKIMVPETEPSETLGQVKLKIERPDVNGLDALSRGALDGLRLALNIAAMLLVFVAMIAMVNAVIGGLGSLVGLDLSLERILGWAFAPFALLMGIPWEEATTVGMLLGEKMILTELIAFLHLSEIQSSLAPLSPRSAVIASYALCGFANFASIGIQIGGIGGIAPERRGDLAKVGFRAMIGGTLAAMMTGNVAGMLYTE
ncbi:MAG: hypothetical protein JW797_17960 [Bradymonadales bacterium]|nr:hypothetical protein [Bradymonadales bacterium]